MISSKATRRSKGIRSARIKKSRSSRHGRGTSVDRSESDFSDSQADVSEINANEQPRFADEVRKITTNVGAGRAL